MDSTRAQRDMRRKAARDHFITEEEMLHEDEYDDIWPARPSNSARRYHGLADVRSETGRAADVQVQQSRRGRAYAANERHTIPPRSAATQGRIPTLQDTPPPRLSFDENEESTRTTAAYTPRRGLALPGSQKRFHWLLFVGLAMLIMILGWVALSALGSWWQITQDDWHYGRPRTFQTDKVVGHHDSPQNPSHFIAMNLNRHIIVIEVPGDNVSKSVVFSGPTLLGPGQDLTPVTLTFQDVNHDGKLDMIVIVQGSQFIFLNENGTFVPASQSPGN